MWIMNEKIKRIRQRVFHRARKIEFYAARFAALNSYIARKAEPKEAEWCAKWIYEIMDNLDYTLREQEYDVEIFKEIYGEETLDLCFWGGGDYRMGEIKDIMQEFDRAVATFGEVKLSIKPKGYDILFDTDADRSHNIELIKRYRVENVD